MATGFDAMTGALLHVDIKGKNNYTLKEKWKNGPKTYLGIASESFPNMFMVSGPGSPSVLTNIIASPPSVVFKTTTSDCLAYAGAYH